jgi:hypothetical protein
VQLSNTDDNIILGSLAHLIPSIEFRGSKWLMSGQIIDVCSSGLFAGSSSSLMQLRPSLCSFLLPLHYNFHLLIASSTYSMLLPPFHRSFHPLIDAASSSLWLQLRPFFLFY